MRRRRRSPMSSPVSCLLVLLLRLGAIEGFAVVETAVIGSAVLQHSHHVALVSHSIPTRNPLQLLSVVQTGAGNLLTQYTHLLKAFPLPTKMATGAALATAGDALAQRRETAANTGAVAVPYSRRRAASFAAFDAAYRCLQHAAFPRIVVACRGQTLAALLQHLPHLSSVPPPLTDATTAATAPSYLAAVEQTLVSQLVIVPFIYYPVFFALTGAIQELSPDQAWCRARDNFLPLMRRNLLFWIPVQFVQFQFVSPDLQIPFLSACGLAWTCVLSAVAGSTARYNTAAVPAGAPTNGDDKGPAYDHGRRSETPLKWSDRETDAVPVLTAASLAKQAELEHKEELKELVVESHL